MVTHSWSTFNPEDSHTLQLFVQHHVYLVEAKYAPTSDLDHDALHALSTSAIRDGFAVTEDQTAAMIFTATESGRINFALHRISRGEAKDRSAEFRLDFTIGGFYACHGLGEPADTMMFTIEPGTYGFRIIREVLDARVTEVHHVREPMERHTLEFWGPL